MAARWRGPLEILWWMGLYINPVSRSKIELTLFSFILHLRFFAPLSVSSERIERNRIQRRTPESSGWFTKRASEDSNGLFTRT